MAIGVLAFCKANIHCLIFLECLKEKIFRCKKIVLRNIEQYLAMKRNISYRDMDVLVEKLPDWYIGHKLNSSSDTDIVNSGVHQAKAGSDGLEMKTSVNKCLK